MAAEAGYFPVAQGVPPLNALRVRKLAPRFNIEFVAQSPIAEITSNQYIGELMQSGDIVQVPVLPAITWDDYTIGGGITHRRPTVTEVEVKVTRSKVTSQEINFVQKIQAMLKDYPQEFAKWAVKGLAPLIATEFFASIVGSAHSDNTGDADGKAGAKTGQILIGSLATPFVVDSVEDSMTLLANCKTVLDEYEVDQEQRWISFVSLLSNYLLRSNVSNQAWIGGSGPSAYRNGRLPNPLAGFNCYECNLLPISDTGIVAIPFGHKQGTVFAQRMFLDRTISDKDDASEFWQMGSLYDWKVVQPKALGCAYVRFA